MKHPVAIVLGLALVLAPTSRASADPTYATRARVAHLHDAEAALAQMTAAERQALELELHTAVRTRCRVGAARATIACMIEVARGICEHRPDPKACVAASDVVLTNQHAESDLVDEPTRMRLVRGSSDYHAAVGAELWSRYALLAAELALAPASADLAAQIDQLCALRDRAVHACEPGAKACLPSIAYQRCAAGLVWFVVNHRESAR